MNAEQLVREELPLFIYKSCLIEGWRHVNLSYVKDVLAGEAVRSINGADKFIRNVNNVWSYVFSNLNDEITINTLKEVNRIYGSNMCFFNGQLGATGMHVANMPYAHTDVLRRSVVTRLADINRIIHPKQKALELFCYLVKGRLFFDGNIQMAYILSNKILIETGVGYFNIEVDHIAEFRKLIVDYCNNENRKTELKEFLTENFILLPE